METTPAVGDKDTNMEITNKAQSIIFQGGKILG